MTQTYLTSDTGKVYTMLGATPRDGCAEQRRHKSSSKKGGLVPPFCFGCA